MTKIIMEKQEITENKIDIRNEHTIFCSITRQQFPTIKELEKEVKELRKELKAKNISIGKTDTLKIMKERKEDYEKMVKEYNQTFDKLVVAWYNKMELEGMHVGYSDDEFYQNVLKQLNFSLTRMGYRDSVLSIIVDIQRKVKDIQQDLKVKSGLSKVWL